MVTSLICMQLNQLRLTGLSREASVINLRNSSQPDDIEVTEPSVLVSTSITSLRFSLSSDNVSATKKQISGQHYLPFQSRFFPMALSALSTRNRHRYLLL